MDSDLFPWGAVALLRQRCGITEPVGRKMLIGAAMEGVITAVAGEINYLIHPVGPALARLSNQLVRRERHELVIARFWRPQHAQIDDLGSGELMRRPQFDWARRRARDFHSTRVRELDSRWEHLKEDGFLYEDVWLETDVNDIYFERSEIEMLAIDPDRMDYVTRQRVSPSERPRPVTPRGPSPALEREQIKAWLVIEAMTRPEAVRPLLGDDDWRGLSELLIGRNPDLDKRQFDEFARLLIREWQTHLNCYPPP